MAALSWWDGQLREAGNWRRTIAIYVMAARPVLRKLGLAGLAASLAIVAVSVVIAGALVVTTLRGQSPPGLRGGSTWAERQVEKNERRLDDHERRLADKTRELAVNGQRLREHEEFRAAIIGLHIGERLAALELYARIGIWLLAALLTGMLALIVEVIARHWPGKG